MTGPTVPFVVRAVYLRRPFWRAPLVADAIVGLTTSGDGGW